MPRSITEIRLMARTHTRTAINVLVGIMRSKDATAAARVTAANAILDRGWGKAAQPLQNGDDGALELIHRIERVIDHTAELIKSLEGFRIAWIDEAQTLSVRRLSLLRPTIRAEASELWASWNGLQLRLMRAMELRARNNGWNCVVSDTTDNVVSANNFIRAGYRLYRRQDPWAWPNTLYWRKVLS